MTTELIAVIAGTALSIVFEVYPKAKEWFDTKTPGQKFLIMAGLGAVGVAGAFGLGCANLFNLSATYPCTQVGAEKAVSDWVAFFAANQITYGGVNTVRKQAGLS